MPMFFMLAEAGSGMSLPGALDLLVKAGAIGLAFLLMKMCFELVKKLIGQQHIERPKLLLVTLYVAAAVCMLVLGAKMQGELQNPQIAVAVKVVPRLKDAALFPEIIAHRDDQAVSDGNVHILLRENDLVTVSVTELWDVMTRQKLLLDGYEQVHAAESGEMGVGHGI